MLYTSMKTHTSSGYFLSPWDDLEAIGYLLVRLAKRKLPWESLIGRTYPSDELLIEAVGHRKKSTAVDILCEGCPKSFQSYITECRCVKDDPEVLPEYEK